MGSPQLSPRTRIGSPLQPGTSQTTLELLNRTSGLFGMLSEMHKLDAGGTLPSEAYNDLMDSLSLLVAANVHPSDARSKNITEILAQITARGSKWPFSIRGKALLVQRTWELKYGRKLTRDVRDDPQRTPSGEKNVAVGVPSSFNLGKLQGILDLSTPSRTFKQALQDRPLPLSLRKETFLPRKLQRTRSMKLGQQLAKLDTLSSSLKLPTNPLLCGHLIYRVGDWWPHPSAAQAVGIIESIIGITGDDEGAYAVLLHSDQEVALDSIWRSRYRAAHDDPNRKRLLKNLRTQDPVRILRTSKQEPCEHNRRPSTGVRYDGLYRVTGYSVKKEKEREVYKYEYVLERLGNQPALEASLSVPTDKHLRLARACDNVVPKPRLGGAVVERKDECESHEELTETLDSQNSSGAAEQDYASVQYARAAAAVERLKRG